MIIEDILMSLPAPTGHSHIHESCFAWLTPNEVDPENSKV